MGAVGTRAADQRPRNSTARSPSPRSIWRFCAARGARVRETVKVELGVGSEAETSSVHAAAYAPTPRLDASTSRSIRRCGSAQGAGQGTTAAPGCLTSALGGPYPDTKVAGISRIPLGAMPSR